MRNPISNPIYNFLFGWRTFLLERSDKGFQIFTSHNFSVPKVCIFSNWIICINSRFFISFYFWNQFVRINVSAHISFFNGGAHYAHPPKI